MKYESLTHNETRTPLTSLQETPPFKKYPYSKITAFEDSEDFLVKSLSLSVLAKQFAGGWPGNEKHFPEMKVPDPTYEECVSAGFQFQALYKELQDQYGIAMQAQFVMGEQETDEIESLRMYVITERIDGIDVSSGEIEGVTDPELLQIVGEEMKNAIHRLFQYYKDKHVANDFFLEDIAVPDQYIYGRPVRGDGEKSSELYLVDIDGHFSKRPVGLHTAFEEMISALDLVAEKYAVESVDLYNEISEYMRTLPAI